jgi:hypothetical protein
MGSRDLTPLTSVRSPLLQEREKIPPRLRRVEEYSTRRKCWDPRSENGGGEYPGFAQLAMTKSVII